MNDWRSKENRKNYLVGLGKLLGYASMEDWYGMTKQHFRDNGGYGLLNKYYAGSPSRILTDLFPEYNWLPWRFNKCPNGFWQSKENRMAYMQWLEQRLGLTKEEDWYKITNKDFENNYGGGLLANYYQDTPYLVIKEYKPDYDWNGWLFSKGFGTPSDYWEKKENRIKYLKWLGAKLNFHSKEDWMAIKQDDFYANSGATILNYNYNGSPFAAVQEYFGDDCFNAWELGKCPNGFWLDANNRKTYMRWLEKRLVITSPEEWYSITINHFVDNLGHGMLVHGCNSSPIKAVKEYLPDYHWLNWLFKNAGHIWNDTENHYKYMAWLGERLQFQKPEDWYHITAQDFIKNNGHSLLVDYYKGSPPLAVICFIKDYAWDIEKFSYGKKKQKRLYKMIKSLYKDYLVEWDFKHQEMRFSNTNKPMELDIFIPELKIAIEYQGEQHFFPIEAWGGTETLLGVQRRDAEKRVRCAEMGIKLIEIDYLWKGDIKHVKDKLGITI